ncbi:MAG: phosphotransferase [Candidatus Levybacteria bacterium]|nr:phosphotransferase [Candidatus Levybacteria bacterium]
MMQAFKIKKNGRILDYLKTEIIDLDKIRAHFSKKFEVKDIRQPGRHIIANIIKGGKKYILKLASTEGIGARTESEALWNKEFNKYSKSDIFRVPKNLDEGYYQGLYFLIIEKFNGPHLSTLRGGNNIVDEYIEKIIDFSEHIQTLPLNIPVNDAIEESDAGKWFVAKSKSWYVNIDSDVVNKYNVDRLLQIVEAGASKLAEKPRHGDFTPWHMIALENGGIGLIDGEHAHSQGIEYYDIAYFIQRLFAVIDRRDQAEKILDELKKRKYGMAKLKTVLASRAIGGFNDEFMAPVPNYEKAQEFSEFIRAL